jgi:hypothetical protein
MRSIGMNQRAAVLVCAVLADRSGLSGAPQREVTLKLVRCDREGSSEERIRDVANVEDADEGLGHAGPIVPFPDGSAEIGALASKAHRLAVFTQRLVVTVDDGRGALWNPAQRRLWCYSFWRRLSAARLSSLSRIAAMRECRP